MKKKSDNSKDAADRLVKVIRRKTRKHYSAEEKIRIVLAGLRGEESIATLCRLEGIADSLSILFLVEGIFGGWEEPLGRRHGTAGMRRVRK